MPQVASTTTITCTSVPQNAAMRVWHWRRIFTSKILRGVVCRGKQQLVLAIPIDVLHRGPGTGNDNCLVQGIASDTELTILPGSDQLHTMALHVFIYWLRLMACIQVAQVSLGTEAWQPGRLGAGHRASRSWPTVYVHNIKKHECNKKGHERHNAAHCRGASTSFPC